MKSREPSQPEPSSIQKWGVMADYLIEIEQYLEWTQRQSMTSWINDYAEKNNKQSSSIWRLLTAGKYYRDLRVEIVAQLAAHCLTASAVPVSSSPGDRSNPEAMASRNA
jgi:hypothetical protein